MKTLFNLTTSFDDMQRFETQDDLLKQMDGFDGVELMHFDEDDRNIIPKDRVIGLHMGFFPYWLDLWHGDTQALCREFDLLENTYRFYGGCDKHVLLNRFQRDLENAHRWDVEYVVFHVSDATIEESFKLNYRHSDEEVIDGAIALLNELFANEDGRIALLVENLWQPGLTFTRPEMTERLMNGIQYPNKGIMLDTGHLLHTNLQLRTQSEGLEYIHLLLDHHGDLCRHIRGVHLNQSLTGEYMEQTMRNPPDLSGDYADRYDKMFWHAFRADQHLPFTCDGIDDLIERIHPQYLTFEFITTDSVQHLEFLNAQKLALKRILKQN